MTDTELTLEEIEYLKKRAKAHDPISIPVRPDVLLRLCTAARKHIEATAGEPKHGLKITANESGVWLNFQASTGKGAMVRADLIAGTVIGQIARRAIYDWMDDVVNAAPSEQEIAGASEGDVLSEFQRGLEAAAIWHDHEAETGGHCGESTSEKIIRQRRNAWHNDSADAIRALKNTGETGGAWLKQHVQAATEEVESWPDHKKNGSTASQPDLSETESVGAKKPLCGAEIPSALMVQPAPSQQGDDDVEAPFVPAAFINVIAEEGSREEAIRWLQKTWNESYKYKAERDSLSKRVERLEGALREIEDRDQVDPHIYKADPVLGPCASIARAALAEEGA